MALLTDGNPNDTEALRVYETGILDLAHVESIDLDAKLGLATEEISQDVLNILLGHTQTPDPQGSVRRTIGVADVVVTRQLKRWHAVHALAVIYRDAYNNQLNDRYRPKWQEYRELSRGARAQAITFGIGLVSNPLPRAGAPLFSVTAGLIPATTYYVQLSWVSTAGQEGSPSAITTYQTVDGSLLVVGATNPPAGAAGWNVYIGLTDSTLALQNNAPLAIGQNFSLPSTGLVTGRAPGDGQSPDIYFTSGWTLQRG
jgi:hypothetical protein